MKDLILKVNTDTDDKDIDKIVKLLNKYNRTEIEFTLDFCELEEIIQYYIIRELDIDLEELGVVINIFNDINRITIEFNADTIDNKTELKYIIDEFKRHFGVNILNCDIRQILRMVFIDCCSYELKEDEIVITFDSEDLYDNWLFKYFKTNQ
jgi:hypothetical protein